MDLVWRDERATVAGVSDGWRLLFSLPLATHTGLEVYGPAFGVWREPLMGNDLLVFLACAGGRELKSLLGRKINQDPQYPLLFLQPLLLRWVCMLF